MKNQSKLFFISRVLPCCVVILALAAPFIWSTWRVQLTYAATRVLKRYPSTELLKSIEDDYLWAPIPHSTIKEDLKFRVALLNLVIQMRRGFKPPKLEGHYDGDLRERAVYAAMVNHPHTDKYFDEFWDTKHFSRDDIKQFSDSYFSKVDSFISKGKYQRASKLLWYSDGITDKDFKLAWESRNKLVQEKLKTENEEQRR